MATPWLISATKLYGLFSKHAAKFELHEFQKLCPTARNSEFQPLMKDAFERFNSSRTDAGSFLHIIIRTFLILSISMY